MSFVARERERDRRKRKRRRRRKEGKKGKKEKAPNLAVHLIATPRVSVDWRSPFVLL